MRGKNPIKTVPLRDRCAAQAVTGDGVRAVTKGDLRSTRGFDTGAAGATLPAFLWQPFGNHSLARALGGPRGRDIMSVHDMEKAEATYEGFMATLKWAVPVIAVIAFAVVAAIAS
jgi:hypothetical protein